jgi:glutathione synthase/RimK-type ligase-like ATP-grasp enzyme
MNLLVVNNKSDFRWNIPGVEVITAKKYLSDERYINLRSAKIFNLCNSYKYQSSGYYVSLLAAARGHKAIPDITTIQDTKTLSIIRLKCDDFEELMQRTLNHVEDKTFVLDVLFGKNPDRRYDTLCNELFNHFKAPLLRGTFIKNESCRWALHNIDLLPTSLLSSEHDQVIEEVAHSFFNHKKLFKNKTSQLPYSMAILVNPAEKTAPSNALALKKFVKAAEAVGIGAWTITRDDYNHLGEYDALFIRETTNVNHYTYRFARRAAVEGLVVIDDPDSIVKCSNKVYLAEVLKHNKVPIPETIIAGKERFAELTKSLSFPMVLKLPDSAFSQGVYKVNDNSELQSLSKTMFDRSELIIAQQFLPTEFDWRVGVLNHKPLYACKYYMANKHWQIINNSNNGTTRFGKTECFPVDMAPVKVIEAAVKAASIIGDGLYGVDVKEINGEPFVMEINDNPNIDSGYEDKFLKGELYLEIMNVFFERIRKSKEV